MSDVDSSEPKAWLVRGSKNSGFDQWMLDEGLTGIDFWEVPALSGVGDLPEMRDVVRSAMPTLKPGAVGNYAAQLFAFASRIAKGDLVILPVRHTAKLAFGVVTGGYEYRDGKGTLNHVRAIEWRRTDVARTAINQDLLYSLGAFSTVVQISRNDAAWRLWQVAKGAETDPGARGGETPALPTADLDAVDSDDAIAEEGFDILRYSKDRVLGRLRERFAGHRLSDLVAAILEAEGMTCKVSPPGAHHRPLQPALAIAHFFIEVVKEIWLLLHGRGNRFGVGLAGEYLHSAPARPAPPSALATTSHLKRQGPHRFNTQYRQSHD